jgi:hypothetical protein
LSLTTTDENPIPTDARQAIGGPATGHETFHPVSWEIPLCCGPLQQGQFSAEATVIPRRMRADRTKCIQKAMLRGIANVGIRTGPIFSLTCISGLTFEFKLSRVGGL